MMNKSLNACSSKKNGYFLILVSSKCGSCIRMTHLLLEFCAVVVVYLESSGLAATYNHTKFLILVLFTFFIKEIYSKSIIRCALW
jgi:hypothetical protein